MPRKIPPRPGRKPAKKKREIRVRLEVPPLTKEQRASLSEVFDTLKVSIQGTPQLAGVIKQALVQKRRR